MPLRTTRIFRPLVIKILASGLFLAGLLIVAGLSTILYYQPLLVDIADPPPTPVLPFPVSVDPTTKTITENPAAFWYVEQEFNTHHIHPVQQDWWQKVVASLIEQDWYQQLAAPSSRLIVIWSGERSEEVATAVGGVLRWDRPERDEFRERVASSTGFVEGAFFPGRYLVSYDASPAVVAAVLSERFANEVTARYTPAVAARVPLSDAIVIASLLEREAYDLADMRIISGVIWNRLFIDMPLQLDATLQYVRGSTPGEPWWPHPRPSDKFLDSPFNTYQNSGLPPAAISNVSLEALFAALNPVPTDCLFYFHERDGTFHCSETYSEHRAKLRTTN